MEPLVVREYIKDIIEEKIKNLHPEVEEIIINNIIERNIKAKHKIIKYVRETLNLPKVGSDKRIYWEKRGWDQKDVENKRVIKKMPSSPMKIENWLSKINDKTGNLYTIDEANYKIKSFRKLNKEFWIEKGYSEEESLVKVKEYQISNKDKYITKILENPENYSDRTTTQIGYWIKKGYSKEESIKIISKRQSTSSLEFYIKRYGEEDGSIRYNSLCELKKYNNSLQHYIDKYGDDEGNILYSSIIKKRMTPLLRASKESFIFLKDIYKYLRYNGVEKNDIYWGVGHSNEWFINCNDMSLFYDFTIPKLKLVIEYHGIKFHPNENDDTVDRKNWKCLFSGLSFDDKLKKDNLKKDIIINNGYTYIDVFSNENLINRKNDIIKIIDEKLK